MPDQGRGLGDLWSPNLCDLQRRGGTPTETEREGSETGGQIRDHRAWKPPEESLAEGRAHRVTGHSKWGLICKEVIFAFGPTGPFLETVHGAQEMETCLEWGKDDCGGNGVVYGVRERAFKERTFRNISTSQAGSG